MTDRIDENPPVSIAEQAAEWLLRWHCGDLSIAERYEYLQWLKRSPVHIAETLRMCRLYSWIQATKLQLFITNEDEFSNVVELPRERMARPTVTRHTTWRGRMVAGVAAIGLGAGSAFVAKVHWLDHTIETQISEWRSMALEDGSTVSAGPRTRLRHDIGEDRRLIRLARGEAMFNVAKDPSRPFLVEAGLAVVEATGTQFAVDRRGGKVTVTVREGSVLVSAAPDGSAAFASVPLTKDQQLAISGSGPGTVRHVDAERLTTWSHGRLTFAEGDQVSDAATQFNERNRLKLLVDPQIGAMPMRGVFDANDPRSFAKMVVRQTGGMLVEDEPGVVRIEPADRTRR